MRVEVRSLTLRVKVRSRLGPRSVRRGVRPGLLPTLLSSPRSRTKNRMCYGVLATKELLHRTYRNLEQRVLLEVRSSPPPGLPGLCPAPPRPLPALLPMERSRCVSAV